MSKQQNMAKMFGRKREILELKLEDAEKNVYWIRADCQMLHKVIKLKCINNFKVA